jgi:hypothetical protein
MTVNYANTGMPRGIMQPSRSQDEPAPQAAREQVAYWMDRKEDVERQLAKAINQAEKHAAARIAKLEDDVQRQSDDLQREKEKHRPCWFCKLRRRQSFSE